MMLDTFTWPAPDDASDERLIADVKRVGWHAVGVAEEADRPPFVYSVGLYLSFGHPELIVVGLRPNVGHALIADVVERLRAGSHVSWDTRYSDIVENFDVVFKVMDESKFREYLGYALWFYRSLLPDSFPTLQLVWPDRSGSFPWEPGFDPALAERQPLLSRTCA